MKGLISVCVVLTAFSLSGGQEDVTGGQEDVTGGQMHMAQAQAGLRGLNLKLEHAKSEPSR